MFLHSLLYHHNRPSTIKHLSVPILQLKLNLSAILHGLVNLFYSASICQKQLLLNASGSQLSISLGIPYFKIYTVECRFPPFAYDATSLYKSNQFLRGIA